MGRSFNKRNPPVRVSLKDIDRIYDWASKNCCLENFVLVRLFKQLGPRTSEVCTLRVEHIDFETYHISIFDSKKKEFFDLPLDIQTLELLKLLVGDRKSGYVFRQLQSWKHVKIDKPLHKVTVWVRIHKIAEAAGVHGVKPRTFRQGFAAEWVYKKKLSRKGVQFFLRHDEYASTDSYVDKITVSEFVEKEYREHFDPIARALNVEALPQVCRNCVSKAVCCHIDEVPEWMTGCKFNPTQTHKELKQLGQ